MALENWNEFSETVVNYVETLTASEDPDDAFTANMAKKWIAKGTNSPRDQVRLSKSIKDLLADYTDSPLNGRSGGSRASGVQRLSAEHQANYASMVSAEYDDEGVTLRISNDILPYHTTFSGRKDDNGEPLTVWPNMETMLDSIMLSKFEAGFVSAHKGDN